MKIIEATEKDLPIIKDIACKTWGQTYSHILSVEQIKYMLDWMYSIESLKDQIQNQNNSFLLIEDNQQYLGFVSYELYYSEEPKTKIHKLYVLPQEHKKGIGAKLMEEVEKIAVMHNNQSIILNMNKENNAIHFYEKKGFRIVDEGCFDIGNGYFMDDFILEKDLSDRKSI